jgi:hypothetical protein
MALVRPRQGWDHLVGLGARRFHLRLLTVSRFAGRRIIISIRRCMDSYSMSGVLKLAPMGRCPRLAYASPAGMRGSNLCASGCFLLTGISATGKVLKGFRSYFRKGIIQTMMEAADEP